MRKQKILEIGPDIKKSSGGMAGVIRKIKNMPWLKEKYEITAYGSFADGGKFYRFFYCIASAVKFRRIVRHYDLIHIHMTSGMSARRKAWYIRKAKRAGKKVIVQLHCTDYFFTRLDKEKERNRENIVRSLQMADAVLLLSKKFEKTFRERTGVQNTYYFPNFIRPEDYPEHKKDPEKFVYLGKLNKDKGIDMLLQALYMMAADGERPEVILAGTGDREKYERLRFCYGLTNVSFSSGWLDQEETKKLLSDSMVLILPSFHEGFPLSVLEGMASGCAVAATCTGAVPEMTEFNLTEPGDTGALFLRLRWLFLHPEMAAQEGRANREVAFSRFSEEKIMRELGNIYGKVLGK